MILLGIGSNLPFRGLTPVQLIDSAKHELTRHHIKIIKSSSYYLTPPMGSKYQPDYVNAVFLVSANFSPEFLLQKLHAIEASFGRQRRAKWSARTLDIDLLDWHGHRLFKRPKLPHPEMQKRAFVLFPLNDVVPCWCHPISGRTAQQMLMSLSVRERAVVKKLS